MASKVKIGGKKVDIFDMSFYSAVKWSTEGFEGVEDENSNWTSYFNDSVEDGSEEAR